jgi:Mg2+ and Co2+ transporter CorA
MAQERDFFAKVFHPYAEIQTSIANYKDGSDDLLKSLIQLSEKLKLLLNIREQADHLKRTIEDLDEIENSADLMYLSYIEPELDGLVRELSSLESIFNRSSKDIYELIEMVEYSNKINLRTFI